MKRSILFILIAVISAIVSCKKQTNTPVFETIISGQFLEGNSKKPIEGAKVSIVHENKTIESAFTDKNGVYNITLKTPNKDDTQYMWKFELDKKYYSESIIKWIKLGEINIHDVEAREGIILKARIICPNCPQPPLNVATSAMTPTPGNLSSLKLDSYDGDETVLLKVLPNVENTIRFTYWNGVSTQWFWYKEEKLNVQESSSTISKTFNLDFKTFTYSFTGN